MMDSANIASYMFCYLLFFSDLSAYPLIRREPLLEAGRGGFERCLDRLHQRAGRLLAELDRYPPGRSELGSEEVDVERVTEGRVHRVVQVDRALAHLDPPGRALGAAADRDLLCQVRAHGQDSFRLRRRDEPRASALSRPPL